MSRLRAKRIRVSGTLVALGPLSVGGLGTEEEVDLPLARNGRGDACIPGTSLAGVLRAWAEDHIAEEGVLRALFGGHGDLDGASRLFVDDAPVDGVVADEVWDGVGIDRQTGGSAHGIKFDRAILPRGTTWPLRLTVDIPPASPELVEPSALEAALGCLVQALREGKVRLGAGTSRGLGRMQLQDTVDVVLEDWSSRAGILTLLSRGAAVAEQADDAVASLVNACPLERRNTRRLDIAIEWEPVGPLMVKAPIDGLAVHAIPFVSGVEPGRMALTIPGSSIKGALRGQAERIVRTVLGVGLQVGPDLDGEPDGNSHRAQIDVPLVRDLFGSARESETTHKGWLAVDSCYAENARPTPASWRAVLEAPPPADRGVVELSALSVATLQAGLAGAQGGTPDLQHAVHVAIDRWTAEALPGALYSALEPLDVCWEPLRLSIDLGHLEPSQQHPAVALLLLVVRDLARQRIPLGHSAHRGFGWLQVTKVAVDACGTIDGLAEGKSQYAPPAICPDGWDVEWLTLLWNEWIDTNLQAVP